MAAKNQNFVDYIKSNGITLSWKSHNNQLISNMQLLFEQEAHFDCTLWANGFAIECHRLVLSACSPFLRNVIESHPEDRPNITLPDLTKEELHAVVEYIYTGETTISNDHVKSFFETCKILGITGLKEYSIVEKDDSERMNLDVDDKETEHTKEVTNLEIKDEDTVEQLEDSNYNMSSMSEPFSDNYDEDSEAFSENSFNIANDMLHVNYNLDSKDFKPSSGKIYSKPSHRFDKKSNGVARYKCTKCGNSYSHKRTLLHHIHWICDQPATYACTLCSYMGKRKFQLKSHMEHVHSKPR